MLESYLKTIINRIRKHSKSKAAKSISLPRPVKFLTSIIQVLTISWFIGGLWFHYKLSAFINVFNLKYSQIANILTYSKYTKVDFVHRESSNFCNRNCFQQMFFIITCMTVVITVVIMLALVLLIFGCFKKDIDLDGEI